jgi:hypothetical protein
MAEETKALEMRVAELEDKLNKLTAAATNIPQVCVLNCFACYSCYSCYICRSCIYECTCGPCACVQQLPATAMSGGFGMLGR